jgi:hypothetical protein
MTAGFTRLILTKFFFLIILFPIGLLTKAYNGFGDEFLKNYFGGIIYVIFFIFLASLVFPKVSIIKIALMVLGITCLLEFSQLIQIGFINESRKFFIIKALIGSVFNFYDFIFYLFGAITGYFVLCLIEDRKTK